MDSRSLDLPNEVDLVINCAIDIPKSTDSKIPVWNFNFWDGTYLDHSQLANVYKVFEENQDKKILIHCFAGISRSPAILAGWLAIQRMTNYEIELYNIQEKRDIVDPDGRVNKSVRDYVNEKLHRN